MQNILLNNFPSSLKVFFSSQLLTKKHYHTIQKMKWKKHFTVVSQKFILHLGINSLVPSLHNYFYIAKQVQTSRECLETDFPPLVATGSQDEANERNYKNNKNLAFIKIFLWEFFNPFFLFHTWRNKIFTTFLIGWKFWSEAIFERLLCAMSLCSLVWSTQSSSTECICSVRN